MECCITKNLIVDDTDIVDEMFKRVMGFSPNWEEIENYISIETETKIFYFDSVLKRKQSNEKGIVYVWIDTGYWYKKTEPLFISLVNQQEYFIGHFLGTGPFLVNGMYQNNPYQIRKIRGNFQSFCLKYKKIVDKRKNKELLKGDVLDLKNSNLSTKSNNSEDNIIPQMKESLPKQRTEVTEEIYNALLYPNWKNIDGLDTYLKVIGRRLTQLIEQEKEEYFVLNNIRSAVINTGLMNPFGTDYLVLYKYYVNKPYYVASKIMNSKTDYLEEGYTREQSQKDLKPISFFDDEKEKYLSVTMDDFDINTKCLSHVVERSIERFPDAFKELSTDRITRILLNAVELGIRFQIKDTNCAKAIYSGGKISWVLPFRVNVDYSEEPELVIVICKCDEFYEVKTILPYDDEMKDKITSVSLYHQLWQ